MSPTPATPTPARSHARKTSLDHLQDALKDLGKAREKGTDEARAAVEDAMDKIREASTEITTRGQDQLTEWEDALDHAAEDARRELGLIAVRAQSSPEALSDLSAEIRKREAELAA
ncbi:MAG: hypothetical protein U0R70_13675 [Solirubrobacteraceae bacterium]